MKQDAQRASGRVVVIGGTFDPIHIGHLGLARAALEHLHASECLLVVGDGHCHRLAPVLLAEERIELVRAALASEPGLERATVLGARGRTLAEVGRALFDRGGDFHFVFGADSARRLIEWGGDTVLRSVGTIWTVDRRHERGPLDIERLDAAVPSVSSTEVRERVAAGERIDHLVPSAVHDAVLHAYAVRERASTHA